MSSEGDRQEIAGDGQVEAAAAETAPEMAAEVEAEGTAQEKKKGRPWGRPSALTVLK